MKKITVILQEKNVKLNSLPENIQTAIENSINLLKYDLRQTNLQIFTSNTLISIN